MEVRGREERLYQGQRRKQVIDFEKLWFVTTSTTFSTSLSTRTTFRTYLSSTLVFNPGYPVSVQSVSLSSVRNSNGQEGVCLYTLRSRQQIVYFHSNYLFWKVGNISDPAKKKSLKSKLLLQRYRAVKLTIFLVYSFGLCARVIGRKWRAFEWRQIEPITAPEINCAT